MDDSDWTLLTRYAAGECSPEERAEVEGHITGPSVYPEALAAIDWVAAHAGAAVPPERRAALQAQLRAKIAVDRRTSYVAFVLKIAAALLIMVGASVGGYFALHRSIRPVATGAIEPSVRTIATTRGQRLSLRLSDGTLVVLAPASTLRVPSAYGVRDRTVELVGQAAFTVTHDEQRPFSVRAGDLVAKDLGTEFIVRAYPDDLHAKVVVREGVVGIRASVIGATAAAQVRAGERGQLSGMGDPLVQPADTAADFAWTEGRLVFRRTPLLEVVAQLQRVYDVEIHLASADLVTRGVSGTVMEARPASQALEMIGAVLHLDAMQTGPRSYTLRAR